MSFAPPAAADTPFRLGDLARVARARSGLVVAVMALTVLATFGVLAVLPTLYASSASVMLDPRKNNVADLSSVLSQLPTDPASLQNQIQILNSRDLAAEVVGKLKLYDDPEFNGALKAGVVDRLLGRGAQGGGDRDKIVDAFQKSVSVDAQGLSTTIVVTATTRDPGKSSAIANTLVDTYIQDQVDAKREAGARTTAWLLDRTQALAAQVQNQEAEVQRYKAEHNLTETATGAPLADEQVGAISNQLVQARTDLATKQATDERVQALIKAGDTADVPQILASPLIVQLRTQQATLIAQESDLTTRYGPKHPKLIAVETQKRDLDAKIAQEVTRLAGSIGNDVAVARAQVGSLEASLRQAESQSSSQNMTRVKLKALEANAQSTRTMYEAFVTRLRETQDQADIQNPDARVISRAPVPTQPSSPKRMMILGASLPVGLVLGILLALIAERLAVPMPASMRPAEAVRPRQAPAYRAAAPHTPSVLGVFDGAYDPRASDAAIDWPNSGFASATRAVLGRVLAMRGGRGAKVIALTATEGGFAKTAIAVALARVAAGGRLRVAVVEGDLNRPVAARAMGLGPARAGLAEVLAGTAALNAALARDPRSQAVVLSSTGPVRDPKAVLGSARMTELIAHLRGRCDLVIVDAPPLFAGEDARLLARLADATLVVVRAETAMSDAVAALGPRTGIVVAR
jgi:polysaccharide biosynthesis transport protein